LLGAYRNLRFLEVSIRFSYPREDNLLGAYGNLRFLEVLIRFSFVYNKKKVHGG
jgi:hypothetical protein